VPNSRLQELAKDEPAQRQRLAELVERLAVPTLRTPSRWPNVVERLECVCDTAMTRLPRSVLHGLLARCLLTSEDGST